MLPEDQEVSRTYWRAGGGALNGGGVSGTKDESEE